MKSSRKIPISSLLLSIILYSFESSSYQHQLMVSHWSLSESNSPEVSRTLLSILSNLNNAVTWMVYTRRSPIIIIIIIILLIWEFFFTPALVDGFFTGVWMTGILLWSPGLFSVYRPISTMLFFDGLHSISNSSNYLSKTLGTVSSAPITNCITVTRIFHSFLSSSFHFRWFSLCGQLGCQTPLYEKFLIFCYH